MNILKTVDLQKIYGQGETEVKALDGVNLEVEKGEFVAIVGTSGSGKSTMLHIIGGLDNPTSGQVIVDGQNLSHMTDEELTIFRRRNIGFVFQQYNLVPMLNVWENIVLPVKLDGKKIEKGYVNGRREGRVFYYSSAINDKKFLEAQVKQFMNFWFDGSLEELVQYACLAKGISKKNAAEVVAAIKELEKK